MPEDIRRMLDAGEITIREAIGLVLENGRGKDRARWTIIDRDARGYAW